MKITNSAFFDTTGYAHKHLFVADEYPWQPLVRLKAYMADFLYPQPGWPQKPGPLPQTMVLHNNILLGSDSCVIEYGNTTRGGLLVRHNDLVLEGASVLMAGAVLAGGPLFLGRGVLIESGAFIKGPAIIGDLTEIRHGAYLRGHCLVGSRCVIGHVTEVKHAILLDDAKAGHFAYLGDSILGNEVNLGAGTKLANLRFSGGDILIKTPAGPINSGLHKFGALFGDRSQTGCNAVTNPGTVLGKKSIVLPNTTVPSGWHGNNTLIR